MIAIKHFPHTVHLAGQNIEIEGFALFRSVFIVAIICYSEGILYLFQFTILFQRFFDQLSEFKSFVNSVF